MSNRYRIKVCGWIVDSEMAAEKDNSQLPENHCYCLVPESEPNMIICKLCKRYFHPGCMKSGRPSNLAGDIYFNYVCATCSSTGEELCERMKLQWTLVVMLSLYNLQLQGGGKCGCFRWREHVCTFIDKHWAVFFGPNKKKTATWHGTVAGTLSSGCPSTFVSGMESLGEQGWWSLRSTKLPSVDEVEKMASAHKSGKRTKAAALPEPFPFVDGLRQRKQNVVEAALALKEKRTSVQGSAKSKHKKARKLKESSVDVDASFDTDSNMEIAKNMDLSQDNLFSSGRDTEASCQTFSAKLDTSSMDADSSEEQLLSTKEKDEPHGLDVNDDDLVTKWLQPRDEEMELDVLDIDTSVAYDTCYTEFGDMLGMMHEDTDVRSSSGDIDDSDEESSLPQEMSADAKKLQQPPETGRKRKAVIKDETPVEQSSVLPRFRLITPHEEQEVLMKLEKSSVVSSSHELKRLRRKLLIRKIKRERNIPIFDLDSEVKKLLGIQSSDNKENTSANPPVVLKTDYRILDRYQVGATMVRGNSCQHASFVTRLMGLDDDQKESIVSPYTARLLKPFIFRDKSAAPLKLKLLHEIVAFPHRKDPNWKPPLRHPIDYSYVRPTHIPGINSLCQEFFWPGIDLSESLQYPDFSCVALYRKVIIGFAFMVPDVKHNEAYITFIFTHPDWRHAGIATFMLYHLIQTCMGKDVTLHVSATNPAFFLYQKFGFKIEECIIDFYDKYLPPNSKECRNALFLRLNR